MYESYLKALLEPLGVYDLRAGSINGAELAALGAGLDTVHEQLETAERGLRYEEFERSKEVLLCREE